MPRESGSDTILVVPGDTFIALTVVRSLGKKRKHVITLCSPDGIARFSRYCQAAFDLPKKREELPAKVFEVIKSEKVSHVIATSDTAILRLNQHRAELERCTRMLFPPPEIAELAIYKDKTLALARTLGVPVPNTIIPESQGNIASASQLRFPVILKPRHQDVLSYGSSLPNFKVKHCATFEQLAVELARFHGSGNYPLVQEYCEGRGVGVEALIHDGEPVLLFQHERVREYPITGGVSTCCKSTRLDPQLRDWSVSLLRAMQWEGVAMVEFRKDDEKGQVVLMEVNGRFWGSIPLAVHAGCDFPYELYKTSSETYEKPKPTDYKIGLRCRAVAGDTKWLLQKLRTHYPWYQALWEYLIDFGPGMTYYSWTWNDPKPALANFMNRCRRVLSSTWSRICYRFSRISTS